MTRRRILFLFFLAALLGLAALCFSPSELGTVREYRVIAWLKYWKVISPQMKNPELLIERLHSPVPSLQEDAAQSIGLLDADPRTTEALRGFLDWKDGSQVAKNAAIWSLGELHDTQSLRALRARVGDERYDQENLRIALFKIEGRGGRTLFPE